MGTAALTDWKNVIPHAAADLFPMMDDESFGKLKADIAKHRGLLHPIILHEGRIVDGRNRYRACCELDIEPTFENWSGDGSLVEYVWSLNGTRRHMTPSQLGAVATEMLPMLEAEAKERKRKAAIEGNKNRHSPVVQIVEQPEPAQAPMETRSVEQAAKIVGTNRQYVSDAKKIKEESPILFEQVKSGEITIPAAKRQLQQPKGECLSGGNHDFDKEACRKCHEPKSTGRQAIEIDEEMAEDVLYDDLCSVIDRHRTKWRFSRESFVNACYKAASYSKKAWKDKP